MYSFKAFCVLSLALISLITAGSHGNRGNQDFITNVEEMEGFPDDAYGELHGYQEVSDDGKFSEAKSQNKCSACACEDIATTALTTAFRIYADTVRSIAANCSSGGGGGGTPAPPPPPPSSCADIKRNNPSSTSGYYDIVVNNRTISVYCNMSTVCGSDGGWTRLGTFDMTNSTVVCPVGLELRTINETRFCILRSRGCTSVMIPSNGIQYSQVCGRVRGYQRNRPDAFWTRGGINGPYIDGVSITRGSPRTHVWSLAAGFSEVRTDTFGCPCNTGSSATTPSYVGNDYYCESASPTNSPESRFYTDDPLWDRKLCRGREGPCCTPSLLPWFLKDIGSSTTENLELRACVNRAGLIEENVGIDQYEFYVK